MIGSTRLSFVVLRFDDYHQSNDIETWQRVLTEYDERGYTGVVGVCPKYGGEVLDEDVMDFLKGLESSGWEIAQHGYSHENIGQGRGGILHDTRSEFGGLPLKEQQRRIEEGRDILTSVDIDPTTFIPPWHEYDRNTIRALSNASFSCLNEGRFFLPRKVDDIIKIPTHPPGITPINISIGTVSCVNHPHLSESPMKDIEAVTDAIHPSRVRTPIKIAEWWESIF